MSRTPYGAGSLPEYAPEGTKVVVKARTADKVNEWNNCRFYIDAA
jgi:hypothetical protein